ncbi:MAG: PepSY domain-containing protein [Marinicellaceae bacterium]
MNNKLIVRKAHRYIGLLVSLQLLAWTLGGIWFTWNDIDKIHGDHLKKTLNNKPKSEILTPQIILNNIQNFSSLEDMKLIYILEEPVYKINYITNSQQINTALINGFTGLPHKNVSKQKAILIAKNHANFEAEIQSIQLITETSNHHEYRGKKLPAWAIQFDYTGSPTFYISEENGKLTSVRHNSWRIFDFFWMLHTMDYQGRDDFGNWLVKIFSIIALITALSGIFLFFISRNRAKS